MSNNTKQTKLLAGVLLAALILSILGLADKVKKAKTSQVKINQMVEQALSEEQGAERGN